MERETREKISETVREILEESNMEETTEHKIRKTASEKLGIDLSEAKYKALVRAVVNKFLEEQQQKQQQEQEDEQVEQKIAGEKEFDDSGDLILCRLSDKRRVTLQDFRGKTLISIREFYSKEGKELPTSKGISLTEEQWSTLKKNVSAIDNAIEKMESRLR